MKRTMIVIFSLLVILTLTFSSALAANPHFVGQVRFTDLGTQLQATGSIAGLGNENIDVRLDATGSATIECTNPGGNVAPGQTKQITASGTAANLEVKNGRVNFVVTTAAPQDPNPAEVCPNPQWTARITDVVFTSATITVFQPAGSGIVVLQATFPIP